jgi:GT2 family glycosyltransferase
LTRFCQEHNFELLDERGNIGFGPAHNQMMSDAFADGAGCYIGVNPDGFLVPGCLGELLDLDASRSGRAMIEAFSLPIEHPKIYDPITLQTPWVSGACFLYPKRIWDEVGGFDRDMPVYCEDVDLSWRVRAAGFDCLVCPSALFFHDVTAREAAERADGRSVRREALMLEGARRLALKWRAPSSFLDRITSQLQGNPTNLSKTIYSDAFDWLPRKVHGPKDAKVCDFDHWLRFAPSRFWNE